jgi:hypothetical protein
MIVAMFPTINVPRSHCAAFRFEAARVALFGAIGALRCELLMGRLLFASAHNRSAFLVFGQRLRAHRRNRL